ncbi:MAG: hypothetical protein KF680_09800 [Cryobacterium sp.]|nr:hypothetical protein [Cryobacterium sp.]
MGELEDEVEQRERAARSGELGTAWQKVQQRIDLNQTTLDDVFSGRDESPEARQLVQQSQRASRQLHEQFAQEAIDDPDSDNPLTELSQLQRDLQQKLDTLNERVKGYER